MANPLLALQVQPSTIDVAGSLGRGQELKTARLGNILQEYKLSQAQKEDAKANALSSFYQQHGAGLASNNQDDFNALAQINPETAIDLKTKALGVDKTKADISKTNLETEAKKADRVASLFGAVIDAPDAAKPMVFQWMRGQAEQDGLDVSKVPPQYSPDLIPILQSGRQAALSAKDQMAAQFERDKFGYQKTNDAANRNVTIRGQNLVDARARDANGAGTKAPPGYRFKPDGVTMEYIPGGPADPTKGAGKKAPTEDQAKNNQLYQRASQQLPIALAHFDDLASTGNQLARGAAGVVSAIPFVDIDPNSVTGNSGRQGENAIKDIAASYLYSVSGATANPGEVANLAMTITPKLTDDKVTKDQKKARLQQMVESIKTRATPSNPADGDPSVSNW